MNSPGLHCRASAVRTGGTVVCTLAYAHRDTRPTPGVVEAASDASLLVYSAMFTEEQSERARSTGHSTAVEAAQVASESGSEKLWLTHISPRHEDDEQRLESQAKQAFEGEVVAVRDGDSTEL